MIKVTADIFSGLPNPEWVVTGDDATTALRTLSQRPLAAAALDSGFQGLGNRGLVVEFLDDHYPATFGLPAKFRLAGGGSSAESFAVEAADRLIAGLTLTGAGTHPAVTQDSASVPLDAALQQYIRESLPGAAGSLATHPTSSAVPGAGALEVSPSAVCFYESTAFNPNFWNDPAHIGKNNCYNYASNRRTDTFAQPGRATGHQYAQINCAQVSNGAVSDGATLSCAPDAQKPRWYMALVIAPGPGFVDFHWYRKATEPFWGHKPGGTAARNYDNSGHLVTDPRTANRGPYTIFCNFLFAQLKMVVK
jgi:hypothetical protein